MTPETMIERPPLRIGEPAPRFSARSTQGPVDLAEFRGRWLMLFAHPADFTPVCTSEFVALAKAAPQFEALDCAMIGVSADSLYSHLAWIRMIRDMAGVEVSFPVVEDPTMEIARAYGMIGCSAQDAGAMRMTCFIDPEGVLQASTCYPASVGRSIPELLRVLQALQQTHAGDVLAPADWQPGEPLLQAPQETAAAALGGVAATDWFYTKAAS
ncbi:peroxiredoxin [Croceicoccus bisphenolivorans]|uniref:peroxiredoxin n=1 Tax=Croceicoccus bisphenolivorans TaxID=1783232 RepID=UPI000832C86C|nr:redoxin domain-containing protein [Croceicoccus bisphenolivorans]